VALGIPQACFFNQFGFSLNLVGVAMTLSKQRQSYKPVICKIVVL